MKTIIVRTVQDDNSRVISNAKDVTVSDTLLTVYLEDSTINFPLVNVQSFEVK